MEVMIANQTGRKTVCVVEVEEDDSSETQIS